MREHPVANYHPSASVGVAHETRAASSGRVTQVSHGFGAGQVRVTRYGNSASGTVERTVRPGFVSRTFVSGGHVMYAHVYQSHVWHQFGRSFAYEAFVPGVRFPAAYYGWALAPWPRPVVYGWGWRVQPWYPVYGVLFTPYPVYTSPDLWMTDYILAQSMQAAYQAQNPAPPPVPSPEWTPAPTPPEPAPDPSLPAPAPQPGDLPPAPPPSDASPAPQSNGEPATPQPNATPIAPSALPPAITPQIKAQLDAQIKVQLREQQAAVATPATLTAQSTPAALRPNHVFFEVVQPLDVPTAHGHCSLSANDYIKRTGEMSSDDWMIPVVVELSRPSDCPEGVATRIGLNDLNAMENEQEAQVLEAMRAASKGMGPNGPPSGAQPTLIVDGNATPDPTALDAFRQVQ
ncbi:MAG TPA: hypothetical protein VEH00_02675 [Steroidobacteraceae bacterium]|nr:hypothetical protein [Steroidobacteraceae bacterium]